MNANELSETEAYAFLASLFPHGLKDAALIAELCPDGWERSPFFACYHPAPEVRYQEFLRVSRNLKNLLSIKRKGAKNDQPILPEEPEPTFEQFLTKHSPPLRKKPNIRLELRKPRKCASKLTAMSCPQSVWPEPLHRLRLCVHFKISSIVSPQVGHLIPTHLNHTFMTEEELLPISALQHWLYCPRQCALIHLEQEWAENKFTAEGRVMHERAHDGPDETRAELRITRGMPVASSKLAISGQCDVVEFHADGTIRPVEYKRGAHAWFHNQLDHSLSSRSSFITDHL